MILFDARAIISYEDFDSFIKKETEFFKKARNTLFEKYTFFFKN